MQEQGLQEVPNPSAMLLEGRLEQVSGTCVTCVMEGTRPILAEVQGLVTKSSLPSPRRMANGFDYNRVAILLAILEKRCGLFYGTLDVYLNVVGGFRLDEPAGDLAVALCLYSSLRDKAIGDRVAAFGELGLGGEVRSVSHATQRIREAERMGFTTCIVPQQSLRNLSTETFQIHLIGVRTLQETFQKLEQLEQL
jgi:DNA repair protein RadA/Sms